MRSFALLFTLVAAGLMVQGCNIFRKSEPAAAASYQCPSCKETVLAYNPARGVPGGFRELKHTCPSCKMGWSSVVSMQSTCTECGKEHLQCPMCRRHR